MSKIVQEKFQYELPGPKPEDSKWVSDKSVRDPGVKAGALAHYASLPPGTDISDQENADIKRMPLSLAGETDVSADTNQKALHAGFSKRKMLPTDDNYTREHNDAFYDPVKVDGEEGFVERNNMLDRI